MKVIHTVQSPGNEPKAYSYTQHTTEAIVIVAAVASLLATDYSDIPESVRPVTRKIEVEF